MWYLYLSEPPARVLWWFVLLGEGLCLAGIAGQMEWFYLLEPDAVQLARLPRAPLYAEYLLWPLLIEEPAPRRVLFLPWLTFLAQVCLAGGICLVFGGTDYPEQELLRAWSVGIFSRMDALLLLIWLTCAVFRIGFLCAAAGELWKKAANCRKGAAG